MEILKFKTEKNCGQFKMMNCTNGGPCGKTDMSAQAITNFPYYKEARIPYSRNHDANGCSVYGGPYCHDISAIFPNFNADPEDPASYDFICTDVDIERTLAAGTKTFFRLGQTIEHHAVKHHVWPPKDNMQWARICEHIIRHYTEGWANGFHYDMPYWEIWNEPDMANEEKDLSKKATWCGTDEQFYDLYEVAAKHLKKCFPHLKIGGPALSCRVPWADKFLCEMQKRNVPIDFFSWHCYSSYPEKADERACQIKELLNKYGYSDAESILNEWNYIKGWSGEDYFYSTISHINEKGAAYIMSYITVCQHSSVDMLMFYDTRPSVYNNLFDYYTRRPIKGYYALYWYGMLYDMQYEFRSENQIPNIYSLAGKGKDGKILAIVTHYNDDDDAPEKQIKLDFGKSGANYEIYAVDKDHTGEKIATTSDLSMTLPLNSFYLIKEV